MISFLSHPWPWYLSGPLLGLIVPLMLFLSNHEFGISGNLQTLCAMCFGRADSKLKFDWRGESWNLVFIAGIAVGGFLANPILHAVPVVQISAHTVQDLAKLGIVHDNGLLPASIFSWSRLFSVPGFIMIVAGGFLVGFGSRWAGGCTSGHGITGLSNFELPSLIAVSAFFVGGIATTFLLLPFVLRL